MVAVICLFAGFDASAQAIAGRRKRTGGVGIVGAGRIVSFVEIKDDSAVLRCIRIEEARCGVSFFAAGEVADDERERAITFSLALEAEFLAVQPENSITRNRERERIAGEILNGNLFGLVVGDEAGDHAIGLV